MRDYRHALDFRLSVGPVNFHDELIADWELAISGETPYKIDPL